MATAPRQPGARSHARLHVVVVAAALLGYLLLPALHATHHLIDKRVDDGRSALGPVVKGQGCHRHACHREPPAPPDEPDPAENRHDHSSCSICLALHAARKSVELPWPAPAIAEAGWSPLQLVESPRQMLARRPLLPRSSRGPPGSA